MLKKSQTATEYLVILGVVVIIAVITVGTLSDVVSLSSDMDERTLRLLLAAQKVGITDYIISDYSTKVELQNNHDNLVRIDSITINNEECLFFFHSDHIIASGKQKTISCENIYELNEDTVLWQIEINWTDMKTQSTYSQSGSDLLLIGSVVEEWQSVLESAGYNEEWGGCLNQSLIGGDNYVCTCDDLNNSRIYLGDTVGTPNYGLIMSANIDFERCESHYTTGEGWKPIAYANHALIDGNNHIINNLYINRPTENNVAFLVRNASAGTYGGNSGASIVNLALLNVNVTGASGVSALYEGRDHPLENLYLTGSVFASGSVGFVSSYLQLNDASDISVKGTVYTNSTSASHYAGGIFGQNWDFSSIDISGLSFKGSVSGYAKVGGLFGRIGSEINLMDSSVDAQITCVDIYCGGVVGEESVASSFSQVTWVNNSLGDPGACIGSASVAPAGTNPIGCEVR